jgi:NAD(P)-dependent dehydrogenase (short-subunit alcohol dehydrogenase family)
MKISYRSNYKYLGQSKTANNLFAIELTRRYANDGIYANSVHTGIIYTEIWKDFTKEELKKVKVLDENENASSWLKSAEQGAATSIWAAVSSELEGKGIWKIAK